MREQNNSANASFSRAESRVADLLSRGYTEKEIASKLFISEHTVRNHTRSIKEKNNLHKNSEIVLLYICSITKKVFDLDKIKELGVSAILLFVNVCDYVK